MLVIVHNAEKLSAFIARNPKVREGAFYLDFEDGTSSVVSVFAANAIKPVSSSVHTDENRDAFLAQYVDLIGEVAKYNGTADYWWASVAASKNRFTSPLPAMLGQFDDAIRALNNMQSNPGSPVLFVAVAPGPVARGLIEHANKTGIVCKVLSVIGANLHHRLRGHYHALKALAVEAIKQTISIWKVRRAYGPLPAGDDRPVYLIKTFASPGSFADGKFNDAFFGGLAKYVEGLSGAPYNVITTAFVTSGKDISYGNMRDLQSQSVVPMESFLRLRDVVTAFFQVLWWSILRPARIPQSLQFNGHDVSVLVAEYMAHGNGGIVYLSHYLHLAIARTINITYPIVACAMTYEGNPWERMFIKGIRDTKDQPLIAGYQHSVVTQASAGVFLGKDEIDIAPLPHSILTTGAATADIISTYGSFPGWRVKPACALRYEYLSNLKGAAPRHRDGSFRVLVALEGVVEVVDMLAYVLRQAPMCANTKFKIRAHPLMPGEVLLRMLGCAVDDLPENVELSAGGSVADDSADCDAILYWGTTVAVEGLAAGKPIINFNRGDRLSFDPLFKLSVFKWTVDSGRDMDDILMEIKNLSDDDYESGQEQAMAYVSTYFYNVNDKSLEQFLPEQLRENRL